jgi:hypothetical protein
VTKAEAEGTAFCSPSACWGLRLPTWRGLLSSCRLPERCPHLVGVLLLGVQERGQAGQRRDVHQLAALAELA